MARCKQCQKSFTDSIPEVRTRWTNGIKTEYTVYHTPDRCLACEGINRENKRRKMLTNRHSITIESAPMSMPLARQEQIMDAHELESLRRVAQRPELGRIVIT